MINKQSEELTGASKHGIGNTVWVDMYEVGKIGPGTIVAVKYTDYGKVIYDVKFRPFPNEPDNADIETIIRDIDSYFVKSETDYLLN